VTLVVQTYQHRAQISAEWIDTITGGHDHRGTRSPGDTITGEISRARVAPGGPRGARRFLDRFEGVDLEVALEATTGWRFVVEELQWAGAEAHLASRRRPTP